MDELLHILRTMPIWQASLLLLAENVLIFGLALLAAEALVRRFAHRRIAVPPPIEPLEVALAASTVLLNTGITVLGLLLWRAGWIRFRNDWGLAALLDALVLLLVMDVAMYWLHRIAHVPAFYPLLHRTHHRYDRPRPLTLFVLNPAECLAFGGLWLVVVMVYPASWLGMSLYLALNVAFGAVGHLGVEPLPAHWQAAPGLRQLGTSSFHSGHHSDPRHNFGFYTLIWDRLFGTLAPASELGTGRPGQAAAPARMVEPVG